MDEKRVTKKYPSSIRNWPEDDRPREKLLKHGEQVLSNAELLAILISVKCQYIGYPILRVNNVNTSVTHAPEVIYFKH